MNHSQWVYIPTAIQREQRRQLKKWLKRVGALLFVTACGFGVYILPGLLHGY